MRGQIGTEYIFLLSLVFVIAATSILQTFKDVEINLAMSSARLACTEMQSRDPGLQCFVLGYSVSNAPPLVQITPQLSSAYSADNRTTLKNLALEKMVKVFRPQEAPDYGHNCMWAAYFQYCMVFPA